MKKFIVMLVMIVLAAGLIPVSGAFAKPEAEERVIVLFKDKVDKQLVNRANGKVNQEYKHIKALAISIPLQAVKGLERNPNVLSVEKDQLIQVEQTLDWGIGRTEAPAAWASDFTGQGIDIAVVDTGIASHEDLRLAGGASFVSYTNSYADDNGHGTHAAGIIGAGDNAYGTVGIAHGANLYALKSLDQNGSGYLSDVVAGIDWSITNRMDIINLSLGTASPSSAMQQAVDQAYSNGILVVAAAGNNGTADGSGDTVNYPARYESAIAVAASTSNDQRASFSATGNTIEVAAPGADVLSTYLGNSYTRMSGTSMAAPYAAGNLALLMQAYPEATHTELRILLQQNVVDLGTAGKDNWFGYGLIQAPGQDTANQTEEVEPAITMTDVFTHKATYYRGESVYITVEVTDGNGSFLSGAETILTITTPQGSSLTGKATTDQSGSVTFVLTTNSWTAKGTYYVKAESSISSYKSSSSTTSFKIR